MVFANKFFQIMIFNVREFLNGELNIHKGSYILCLLCSFFVFSFWTFDVKQCSLSPHVIEKILKKTFCQKLWKNHPPIVYIQVRSTYNLNGYDGAKIGEG